jgi:hypothetical protein
MSNSKFEKYVIFYVGTAFYISHMLYGGKPAGLE